MRVVLEINALSCKIQSTKWFPLKIWIFLIGLTFGIEGVLQYERSFNSVRVFICMIIMH